jgi:Tol biopolymer transport system component
LIYDNGYSLYLQPLRGGNPIGLAEYLGGGFIDAHWGPNSDAIVCGIRNSHALTIFSTDSSLVVDRVNLGIQSLWPCWSSNNPVYGSHIAAGSDYIYMMRPDGSEGTIVVYDGGQPSWSPDGTQLAFIRRQQVYVMQVLSTF